MISNPTKPNPCFVCGERASGHAYSCIGLPFDIKIYSCKAHKQEAEAEIKKINNDYLEMMEKYAKALRKRFGGNGNHG